MKNGDFPSFFVNIDQAGYLLMGGFLNYGKPLESSI